MHMEKKVYLIGAGPGDLGLMTVKGMEAIRHADVLIYDYLANPALLAEAPAGAQKVYVGKQAGNHAKTQDEINEILVEEGRKAQCVVRLKGGDPYVFGRGGEEAEILQAAGISFEVVPGITSAIAGPAYAGIPVTHRGISTSFHVMTGHFKDPSQHWDWEALARLKGTLIFLMGVGNLQTISHELQKAGKDKHTPAALIRWATHGHQQTVTGTLETIYKEAKEAGIRPPALIVIGDVVKKREHLNFFEQRPLFGKRIVVTRARAQASGLAGQLEGLGAQVVQLPMIKIEQPDDLSPLIKSIQALERYTILLFTSANGVRAFFRQVHSQGLDARALHGKRIVSMGNSTTDALRQQGVLPDLIPERHTSEGIVALLENEISAEDVLLLPRAKRSRGIIERELGRICKVDPVIAYQNVIVAGAADQLKEAVQAGDFDAVTFTSASTVYNYFDTLKAASLEWHERSKAISIGPITTAALRAHGVKEIEEAQNPTIGDMVQLLVEDQKRSEG